MITSANSAELRKTLLLDGSRLANSPVAIPITNPPNVAVTRRFIPPTTTPTKAGITTRKP